MNDFLIDGGQRRGHDRIFTVEDDLAVLGEVGEEVVDVLSEHPGGSGGHHAGDVLHAGNEHAVFGAEFFASLGEGAVTTLVDGDVNDNGAGVHGLHHFFGHDNGSEFAGDEGGADNDVSGHDGVADSGAFLFEPFSGELESVAALTDSEFSGNAGLEGLGAEGASLFGSGGTDVDGGDHSAETLGGGDGLETSNAGTDDDHVSGLQHADGGADHGHELGHVAGSHEHALVTGDSGHGGQGVHGLSAGDTGDTVEGEGDAAGVAELLHGLAVHGSGGMQEGDEVLAVTEHFGFVLANFFVEEGFLNLQDDVGLGEDFVGAFDDGSASGHVFFIAEEGLVASTLLHENGGAFGDHLLHGFGGGGHAAFAVHDFSGHTDDHTFKFHGSFSYESLRFAVSIILDRAAVTQVSRCYVVKSLGKG